MNKRICGVPHNCDTADMKGFLKFDEGGETESKPILDKLVLRIDLIPDKSLDTWTSLLNKLDDYLCRELEKGDIAAYSITLYDTTSTLAKVQRDTKPSKEEIIDFLEGWLSWITGELIQKYRESPNEALLKVKKLVDSWVRSRGLSINKEEGRLNFET